MENVETIKSYDTIIHIPRYREQKMQIPCLVRSFLGISVFAQMAPATMIKTTTIQKSPRSVLVAKIAVSSSNLAHLRFLFLTLFSSRVSKGEIIL